MFDKLPLKALKQLIQEYKLSTTITLTKVIEGKRTTKTKKELAEELHKHLAIRESDGEIIMKKHVFGKLPATTPIKKEKKKKVVKPKTQTITPTPIIEPPPSVLDLPKPVPAPMPTPTTKDEIEYNKLDYEIETMIWQFIQTRIPLKELKEIYEMKHPDAKNKSEEVLRKELPQKESLKNTMDLLKTINKPFYDSVEKEAKTLIKFIQPSVKKNPLKLEKGFEFIKELKKKGENANVEYSATGLVSEILTLLFFEKYNSGCPMKFIEIQEKSRWRLPKFLKSFKRCLDLGEKTICVPLSSANHMNLLIFKIDTREIIRFEPHGEATHGNTKDKMDIEFNNFCKKLTEDINDYLNLNIKGKRPFKFVPPTDICPRVPNFEGAYKRGFQSMENVMNSKTGFCQLWSMFFMECVLRNPDMDIRDVYKEAYDVMKDQPSFFLAVIKGYFVEVNELLTDINFFQKSIKASELKVIHWENFYDKYYRYLKKINDDNEKKPKIPFTGKGNFKLPKIYKK
jgi:hypothetical protein